MQDEPERWCPEITEVTGPITGYHLDQNIWFLYYFWFISKSPNLKKKKEKKKTYKLLFFLWNARSVKRTTTMVYFPIKTHPVRLFIRLHPTAIYRRWHFFLTFIFVLSSLTFISPIKTPPASYFWISTSTRPELVQEAEAYLSIRRRHDRQLSRTSSLSWLVACMQVFLSTHV